MGYVRAIIVEMLLCSLPLTALYISQAQGDEQSPAGVERADDSDAFLP